MGLAFTMQIGHYIWGLSRPPRTMGGLKPPSPGCTSGLISYDIAEVGNVQVQLRLRREGCNRTYFSDVTMRSPKIIATSHVVRFLGAKMAFRLAYDYFNVFGCVRFALDRFCHLIRYISEVQLVTKESKKVATLLPNIPEFNSVLGGSHLVSRP